MDRRKNVGGGGRRVLLWSLTILLLFTIPLCLLLVLSSPPKVIVFWWAEEYDDRRVDQREEPPAPAPGPRPAPPARAPFGAHQRGHQQKTAEPAGPGPAKVLLISYDGFRWDYIDKNPNTPTFRWLISNGVYATQGLLNTFITITAPNHYGIVTGLFEESHGIVANQFYGPELNETFNYFEDRQATDPRFFGGEPVWVTNDKASGPGPAAGRATGCQMWVGCDIPIKGHLPKHYVSWDGDLAWTTRVDSVIGWFTDPDDPINLGLLYIEEPDETGHQYGPDDPRTKAMVSKLDQLTAYLLWRLYSEGLLDRVNLLFTADHGMASVPWANVVNLDQHVNRSLYKVFGGTPNWNVMPVVPGAEKQIYEALHDKVPHLTVYNKTTIPLAYHYTNTPHVLPLQFVSDIHWRLAHNDTLQKPHIYRKTVRGRVLSRKLEMSNATVGEHGYNNSLPDMHPYFIGHGPAFKQGYNISQFMNVDLYPLMCHILGVKPAPNNGSLERVRALLAKPGDRRDRDPPAWMRAYAGGGRGPPTNGDADGEDDGNYSFKAPRHYFPSVTYSINFDIFVMTLLICAYAAIMMGMSERVRDRCRRQQAPVPTLAATSDPEKCSVIKVVA